MPQTWLCWSWSIVRPLKSPRLPKRSRQRSPRKPRRVRRRRRLSLGLPPWAMPEVVDLQSLREAIEQVDRDILGLLKRRMELSEQVAETKIEAAVPFRDLTREDRVLRRVRQ